MEEKDQITITLPNGRIAILSIQPFNTQLEIDDILRIDYSNIMGEILTFPLMFNRIANFKAEMENAVSEAKLDLEVFEAQLFEEHKKSLVGKEEKPTEANIKAAIQRDTRYSVKKKWYFKVQKDLAYMDSLYWSAQSKDTKLNRFSEKIRPEDFEKELLEDTINGIYIKISKALIN